MSFSDALARLPRQHQTFKTCGKGASSPFACLRLVLAYLGITRTNYEMDDCYVAFIAGRLFFRGERAWSV
jgi:hypothetical protein